MQEKRRIFQIDSSKGKLNSEWIYEVIVSPKMPTKNFKDFCPTKQKRIIAKKTAYTPDCYTHQKITKKSATILVCLVGQKSGKILVDILGETMVSYIHSEFDRLLPII